MSIYDRQSTSVLQKVLAGMERDYDRTHQLHSAAHYSNQLARIRHVLEKRATTNPNRYVTSKLRL